MKPDNFISADELRGLIAEVLLERDRRDAAPRKRHGKPLTFSKRLMVFASVMYALTWAVAAASWFLNQTYPSGLTQYATWLYGAALAFYGAKAGVENVTKNNKKEEANEHEHSAKTQP